MKRRQNAGRTTLKPSRESFRALTHEQVAQVNERCMQQGRFVHWLVGISLGLLMVACAARPSKGYDSALALATKSKQQSQYNDYVIAFIQSQNEQRLDDNSGCYKIEAMSKIDLILIVNEAGVIYDTQTNSDGKRARCFRAAYLNAKMPVPPFSPLAVRLTMN
jgi:hypothetical protein